LYSITKGQRAIVEFTRAMRDTTGNLPPLPGVYPDYLALIVRNAPDGVRELAMARWGNAVLSEASSKPSLALKQGSAPVVLRSTPS
jgi:putative SOS response-associated peptidase YedK